MEPDMLHSAADALLTFLHSFKDGGGIALHSPHRALFIILALHHVWSLHWRMLYLFAGVCMGLALGILPGIGGGGGRPPPPPFPYKNQAPARLSVLLGGG